MIYLRLESVSTQLNKWNLPLRPQRPQVSTRVNDFKALLYMLTESDDELPEDFDVDATPLDLRILASGQRWTMTEWNQRVQMTDRLNPLIVFSKTYCPFSQKAKRLLASYDISPAPRIIEVDTRDDGPLLKRLLGRFTAHNTFPNIVLRGNSLGGSDDLQKLHAEGELRKLLEKEGFSFGVGRSG